MAAASSSSRSPDPIHPENPRSSPVRVVCADGVARTSLEMVSHTTAESFKGFLDYLKRGWDFKGIKDVPPLGIILFPTLMEEAWTWQRIVPWMGGFVIFKDYMDYLKDYFFPKNARDPRVLTVLRDAARKCLKMEKKYVKSRRGHLSEEEERLSREIMQLADDMRNSGGASVAAAACLMCIAEEAKLMSKLSASDTEMFIFSNKVRLYASKIMTYQGPESEGIAAGMMGMTKEARIARKLLNAEDNRSFIKKEICQSIRKDSLNLFIILKAIFVDKAPATSAIDKTKGKLNDDNSAGNNNPMDINQHKNMKKRSRMEKIQDSEAMMVSTSLQRL